MPTYRDIAVWHARHLRGSSCGSTASGRSCEENLATFLCFLIKAGHEMAQLFEAPRYKPEGCGFDSLTMELGSTQPLTEMSTKNISWGVKAAGS